MNILQTPARFPPYVGGVEQYAYTLSKELVKQGHDVTVICANEPESSPMQEIYEGINVLRLNYLGKIAQTNLTPRLPLTLYREVQNADIVHTHLPTPWTADVSVLIATLTGTPSVVTYHNDIRGDGIASHVADLYNTTAMPVTLSLTDQIITTQESYFENSNIPERFEDKVVTIRNGVDVERFQMRDIDDEISCKLGFDMKKTNLFFLSVLDAYHGYKGLENLLEAMQYLPDEYHLLVGGDGPKREYYEQRASDLDVNDQVQFVGYIPDDELPGYYSSADIFVLPSTSSEQEGFGLVLLEALACGTPVVTTSVVGVADDIIREGLGAVISSSKPHLLVDAIDSVASMTIRSERARTLCVDNYSWTEIARQLEHLYEHLTPPIPPRSTLNGGEI